MYNRTLRINQRFLKYKIRTASKEKVRGKPQNRLMGIGGTDVLQANPLGLGLVLNLNRNLNLNININIHLTGPIRHTCYTCVPYHTRRNDLSVPIYSGWPFL